MEVALAVASKQLNAAGRGACRFAAIFENGQIGSGCRVETAGRQRNRRAGERHGHNLTKRAVACAEAQGHALVQPVQGHEIELAVAVYIQQGDCHRPGTGRIDRSDAIRAGRVGEQNRNAARLLAVRVRAAIVGNREIGMARTGQIAGGHRDRLLTGHIAARRLEAAVAVALRHGDGFREQVDGGHIHVAAAVEASQHCAGGSIADYEMLRALEGAVALAGQNAESVAGLVDDNQVGNSVAVHIGNLRRHGRNANRIRSSGIEAAVALAHQHGNLPAVRAGHNQIGGRRRGSGRRS